MMQTMVNSTSKNEHFNMLMLACTSKSKALSVYLYITSQTIKFRGLNIKWLTRVKGITFIIIKEFMLNMGNSGNVTLNIHPKTVVSSITQLQLKIHRQF